MKKIGIFLMVCLFVLMGCTPTKPTVKMDRVSGIVAITYDELKEKMENNHDFILYIGRSDCRDCIEFYPQLEAYLDEHKDFGVYYLDIKAFRDASRKEGATKEEKEFFETLTETLEIEWVPTLQHRQGKEILSSITYLDMDFYEIEDEKEKEEAKQKFIQDIKTWIEKKHQ